MYLLEINDIHFIRLKSEDFTQARREASEILEFKDPATIKSRILFAGPSADYTQGSNISPCPTCDTEVYFKTSLSVRAEDAVCWKCFCDKTKS